MKREAWLALEKSRRQAYGLLNAQGGWGGWQMNLTGEYALYGALIHHVPKSLVRYEGWLIQHCLYPNNMQIRLSKDAESSIVVNTFEALRILSNVRHPPM